jgi:type I restriction enzyme S subunit
MSEWREVTLGDLCERVTVGHVGKMADNYIADGIPFLRSQNVRPFTIEDKGMLFIGDDFNTKLRKSSLAVGDVVVVRTGYPGTAAVIPAKLHGANCADLVVITPSRQLNPHVLAALFNSVYGQAAVKSQLVGAAQQHFNVGSAKTMRVRLPDREGQDRIADVLLAFNGLIENNRRRAQVLEGIARATYREWFVKFRYPGYESVPLVDSALGLIPEGWNVQAASGAVEINPSIKITRSAEHPFIAMGDVSETSMVCSPSETRVGGSGARFENGDTLLARINPSLQNGKTGFVQSLEDGEVGLGSTEFIVMRGRQVGRAFTYCLARQEEFRGNAIASMVGASGRQRVRNECFDTYFLAVPPQGVAQSFEAAAAPMFAQVGLLHRQATYLGALRDLLLPRLVTGQIDVTSRNLDRVLEEAVA